MTARRARTTITAVEGSVPRPAPIHRSVPLLIALAVYAAAVAWVGISVAFDRMPLTVPFAVPAPWVFLLLVPSAAAILLALRGIVLWSIVAAVLGLALVLPGAAACVAVVVASWVVARTRSRWAAHDLDTVLTTAAERDLPVLVVEHVAGGARRRRDAQSIQVQVRDVDSGALATARLWGTTTVGTHLVRQGMNVIASAPPGAEAHLRRWVERQNRAAASTADSRP